MNPRQLQPGLRMRARRRRAKAGMTLIEVLIASAILVFGMVGILAMFNAAAKTHKRAVDETTATMVGTSVMSEMRGLFARGKRPVETALPGKNGKLDKLPESEDYPGYRYSARIVDLNPERKLKDQAVFGKEYFVEVVVYWADRGADKSISFSTVMFMRSPE